MSKITTTKHLNLEFLKQFKNRITRGHTYGFIADSQFEGSAADIDDFLSSERSERIDVLRSMIYGKRIESENVQLLIRFIDWVQDEVYTMYDDIDPQLNEKDYFVTVINDSGGSASIFKCLYNNNGGPSTVKPSILGVQYKEANLYQEDGYIWKWICDVSAEQLRKFKTDEFIPISSRIAELDSTELNPGSIEVVKVENRGSGYRNYYRFQLESDLKISIIDESTANPTIKLKIPPAVLVQVSSAGTYETVRLTADTPGQFNGCILHTDGQYSIITSTEIINGEMTISLADNIAITTQHVIEISPAVIIEGNGLEDNDNPAIGKAIVDIVGDGGIIAVEMLETGRNYSYATSRVNAGSIIPSILAETRPIISPRNGHGSNIEEELNSRAVAILTEFDGDEEGLAITNYSFAQFGILQDPAFANVSIDIGALDLNPSALGSFARDEEVIHYNISPAFEEKVSILDTTVSADTESDVDFQSYFSPGDFVHLTDESQDYDYHFSEIVSVGKNTISLKDTNVSLTETTDFTLKLHSAKIITRGRIITRSSNSSTPNRFYVDGISRAPQRDKIIIGLTSRAIGRVNNTNINNKLADGSIHQFNVFIQASRCVGTFNGMGGAFSPREEVTCTHNGNIIATAEVVTVNEFQGTADVYLINIEGRVIPGSTLTSGSNKSFDIDDKYNGELDVTRGSILYLQNDVAVNRDADSKENIRVILEL